MRARPQKAEPGLECCAEIGLVEAISFSSSQSKAAQRPRSFLACWKGALINSAKMGQN